MLNPRSFLAALALAVLFAARSAPELAERLVLAAGAVVSGAGPACAERLLSIPLCTVFKL
ncbi:MAG: hypothetical protein AUJ49_13665 [Desulfovibrionaceae bacterium CG1_02_65_16]|nr:MAG: hypothetical protein AUJ49_13665 [Desulfovibrionaceae bacterium CG1_02_65_16]